MRSLLLQGGLVLGLGDEFEVGGGYLDGGTAEGGDIDTETLDAGRIDTGELTDDTLEGASDDTDIIALAKGVGHELYRGIGLIEHVLQTLYLMVGDDDIGMETFVGGGGGAVYHEGLDEGIGDQLIALPPIYIYKKVGGDTDDLYLTATALPVVDLHLCGSESLETFFQEYVTTGLLGVVPYSCHAPLTRRYAYGIANYRSCRKC